MIDAGSLAASVQRPQQRQGAPLTILPAIELESPMGQPFQPQSPFQFNQQAGASVYKRYLAVAPWTPEIDDAILAYGLSPYHVIEKGDILVVPGVSPYRFPIDDADSYPGSHIEIYTLQPPSAKPVGPPGGA